MAVVALMAVVAAEAKLAAGSVARLVMAVQAEAMAVEAEVLAVRLMVAETQLLPAVAGETRPRRPG